jgi:cyclopropane fatty-acyl-phospholipid synthase-like methyltransferase
MRRTSPPLASTVAALFRRFLRMWEFYFCYCEGAFAERYLTDAQLILTRQAA